MLNFTVARRPRTPEEAFALAWEHQALAVDTLARPGVSFRDHARTLLAVDRWFLHNRP